MEMMELILNQTSSKLVCENEQNLKFLKSKKISFKIPPEVS
jgi:hypothetical protein